MGDWKGIANAFGSKQWAYKRLRQVKVLNPASPGDMLSCTAIHCHLGNIE